MVQVDLCWSVLRSALVGPHFGFPWPPTPFAALTLCTDQDWRENATCRRTHEWRDAPSILVREPTGDTDAGSHSTWHVDRTTEPSRRIPR